MEGEKFRQAQQALEYVLDHLNPEDRFNVIAFNSGLQSYADELRPAFEADEAARWVRSLSAAGSTDINRALLEAMAQSRDQRPTLLLFLTDGLPTEGVTDSQSILANVADAAPDRLSLFAFGVGYDVDTVLLDSLAQDHHGATSYVTPGESIDEAVSGFYARVSAPVLTDLELDFGDAEAFDLCPAALPDLFAGGQLVIVGRYRQPGGGTIRLSGSVEGEPRAFSYPDQSLRASGGPDFLPRLWATRKIGALLNEIRLNGPEEEVIEQIVRLSIRYGIVTPYTSYLVTEPEALGADALEGIVADEVQRMLAAPTAVSGEAAVEQSAAASGFGGADVPVAPPSEAADLVRIAGSRTFRLVDGVWIDTAFDPDSMTTLKVAFASEDYFALAASRPDFAAAFALGDRVIVLAAGEAYEVVASDEAGDPITIPPARAPGSDEQAPAPEHPIREESAPDRSPSGFSLPCPGSAMLLGIVAVPWARRRRG
jgi:Ca-activated chloride channel family protein